MGIEVVEDITGSLLNNSLHIIAGGIKGQGNTGKSIFHVLLTCIFFNPTRGTHPQERLEIFFLPVSASMGEDYSEGETLLKDTTNSIGIYVRFLGNEHLVRRAKSKRTQPDTLLEKDKPIRFKPYRFFDVLT